MRGRFNSIASMGWPREIPLWVAEGYKRLMIPA